MISSQLLRSTLKPFPETFKQLVIKNQAICRRLVSHQSCLETRDPKDMRKFVRDSLSRHQSKLISIQEIVLRESSQTNGQIDWNSLIARLSDQRLTRAVTFQGDIMSALLLNSGQIIKVDKNLFESVVKYLREVPNLLANQIATCHYCHFVGHFPHFIDDTDVQLIRNTTDQLMAKYSDNKMNAEILSLCFIGLCKSSKDNCIHAIKLLDQIKEPNLKMVFISIDSSLDYNLFEQSLNLIKKYSNHKPNEKLVSKIIKTFSQFELSFDQTIDLLTYLSDNLIVFSGELKPLIARLIEKFSYEMKSTSVTKHGFCLKCEHTLKDISAEEQIDLFKQFYSRVFNNENDLLMKAFPEYEEELNNFNRFIRRLTSKRPLDLVIDGLNMSYAFTPFIVEDHKKLRQFNIKYPTKQVDSNLVQILSNKTIESFENILIIGRKHMKEWKRLREYLVGQTDRISMFYAMNKTQDDCYVLYATLQNPNTLLLSNDFYRDYKYRVTANGQSEQQFERWLTTHQLIYTKHSIALPDRFDHKIHISSDKRILHIPFETKSGSTEWLCCVRK